MIRVHQARYIWIVRNFRMAVATCSRLCVFGNVSVLISFIKKLMVTGFTVHTVFVNVLGMVENNQTCAVI
jgi:hypothetical protein